MVLFGADRAAEYAHFFTGRVALLTAPSGRTTDNRSTIEVLQGCCDLRLLLAPEHGVRGDKAAGALFADEIDAESGLPVRKFFNTSGLLYKSLALKDKLSAMEEEEMLRLLATDGMLVKRPLLIGENFALVGFKESQWAEACGSGQK